MYLVGGLTDQFPYFAQMLFGREDVTEADSHYGSAAQVRLRKIGAPARVDPLHHLAVQFVELVCCSRGRRPRPDITDAG